MGKKALLDESQCWFSKQFQIVPFALLERFLVENCGLQETRIDLDRSGAESLLQLRCVWAFAFWAKHSIDLALHLIGDCLGLNRSERIQWGNGRKMVLLDNTEIAQNVWQIVDSAFGDFDVCCVGHGEDRCIR